MKKALCGAYSGQEKAGSDEGGAEVEEPAELCNICVRHLRRRRKG